MLGVSPLNGPCNVRPEFNWGSNVDSGHQVGNKKNPLLHQSIVGDIN